ncbi:TonB C-terminal domain-containing protein [Aggregicoccus sp. 17bor-14]|uniref:TonB C-terminal domain-containing protein n=1 Tax=Myxococcaceae TaxID=31 RepID=UPI00129C43CB|nr:TonB C-terminal domain-containing protein [Simulacricoccus sp. 17bor-14]MRI88692.1 TonB C-terminal domain-containing protein [Aggregicoccus sp. 17bor-14]
MSLALHLLVLFALHAKAPAPPTPRPPALEVEVVHLPPSPPAQVASAPAPPPAPAAAPSRVRKRKEERTAQAPAAPPAAQPPAAAPSASDVPRAPAADAPVADRGTLLTPTLRPPPPPPDDGVRVEGGEGGLQARGPRGDVAGNILRESQGQQNVARGSVHAYFGQLRDVLEAVWNVRRVAREDRRKSRVGAQVRLTQGADGALRAIELVFSSSDDDIDKGLIQDLRAAAHDLPRPPPEVVRGRAEFTSLWTFQFMARSPYRAKGAIATFDVMNLVDKKAIPPPLDKRVELLEAN